MYEEHPILRDITLIILDIIFIALWIITIVFKDESIPIGLIVFMYIAGILSLLFIGPFIKLLIEDIKNECVVENIKDDIKAFKEAFEEDYDYQISCASNKTLPKEIPYEPNKSLPKDKSFSCPYCGTMYTKKMLKEYDRCPNCGAPFAIFDKET